MIEFKTGRKQAMPMIFANVEVDQFFVDDEGNLSQKVSSDCYLVIARGDGTPYAISRNEAGPEEKVQRILPRVTKISFPGMEKQYV